MSTQIDVLASDPVTESTSSQTAPGCSGLCRRIAAAVAAGALVCGFVTGGALAASTSGRDAHATTVAAGPCAPWVPRPPSWCPIYGSPTGGVAGEQ